MDFFFLSCSWFRLGLQYVCFVSWIWFMFLMLILYMVVQVDPCLRFPSDLEMKMCGGGRGYFVVKVRCGRFSVKVAYDTPFFSLWGEGDIIWPQKLSWNNWRHRTSIFNRFSPVLIRLMWQGLEWSKVYTIDLDFGPCHAAK